MKIISLCGENLASLSAPFDINFAQGVLADAGLFAICGNTGSGKSTLLDAICLSLFDAMPRFSTNRRGPAIGHAQSEESDRLKSNDVRHIMTRGAGACHASVIFETDGGKQYQAQWSVKRARGSATGRIQAQEMQLTQCETNQVIAVKKTEVLAQIESLIGLNYEQFRRSVMLAQGDFAAFLKAPAKERSDLLERITGTELYSTISKLAFSTAKDSEQQLKLLQAQLNDVTLLTDEEQATLAKKIGSVNDALTNQNQQASKLQWLGQTLEQRGALAQQLTENTEILTQTQQQCDNQQDVTQLLEQVELAQGARVTSVQLVQHNQDIAVLTEQQAALGEKYVQQQQNVEQTSEQVAQLAQVKEQAQTDYDAKLPHIELAITRLSELDVLEDKIAQDINQSSLVKQQQQDIESKLKNNDQQVINNQQLTNELAQYLSKHLATANVVNELSAIEQGIDDYLQQQQGHQQYQQQIEQSNINLTKLQARVGAELTEVKAQQQLIKELAVKLQEYALAFKDSNLEELEHNQQLQQAQLVELSAQQQKVTQGLEYQSMIGQKEQQLQDVVQHLEQLRRQYQEVKNDLNQQVPALNEAEKALFDARNVMSLHDHRQQLIDGEPCALCGSQEHPYAQQLNVGELLVEQLNTRFSQLSEKVNELNTRLTQLDAIGKEQAAQREGIGQEITGLNELLQSLGHSPVNLPELARIETHIASLKQQIEQNKIAYQQTALQVEQARAIENQHTTASHHCELATQQVTNSTTAAANIEAELVIAHQYLAQHQQQMSARIVVLTQTYSQANWQQLLDQPDQINSFKQQLVDDIEQYIEKSKLHDEQLNTGRELEQSKIMLLEQQRQYALQLAPIAAQLANDQQQIQQWHTELNELTNGVNPREHKAALEQQNEQLTQALHNAQQALSQLNNELVVSDNNRQQNQQRHQALLEQIQQLEQDWLAWQQRLAIDHQTLNDLLGYDAQWLAEQKQQQAALLQQLHQHQAITTQLATQIEQIDLKLQQREAALLELLPSLAPQPSVSTEQQREMLTQSIASTIQSLTEEQFGVRSQLESHNKSMLQFGQLQQQIDAQTQDTKLWLDMKDLIGSADGAKFRTFAQGLTLQQMLVSANHHLQQLAPRYQLQGVPGNELELQVVDLDMGDEIRSIDSLSGGECFLVSLALALGLGSITSLQTSINTLFIDEGFGTLDPDTLEIALSCLDSLQASGRQIGIISHVQGLVERVGTRIQITAQGSGQSYIELLAR